MQGGYVSCKKPISGRCQPGCRKVSSKQCVPIPKYEAFRIQGGDEDSVDFHKQYLASLQAGKFNDEEENPSNDDASDPVLLQANTSEMRKLIRRRAKRQEKIDEIRIRLLQRDIVNSQIRNRLVDPDPLDPRGGFRVTNLASHGLQAGDFGDCFRSNDFIRRRNFERKQQELRQMEEETNVFKKGARVFKANSSELKEKVSLLRNDLQSF